jgi:hypothetical protein
MCPSGRTEVKTKFSKTFDTFFFPVGDEIPQILEEWIAFLRKEKFWVNDDPLFSWGEDHAYSRASVGSDRPGHISKERCVSHSGNLSASLQ